MREPRDGDFVAYIEALQQESAARLARSHAGVAGPAPGSRGSEPFPGDRRGAGAPVVASAPGAVQAGDADADARLMKTLVAAVVGVALLLAWIGDGGLVPLFVGAALLAYAVPRLRGVLRMLRSGSSNRGAIEEVFGRSPSPTAVKKR